MASTTRESGFQFGDLDSALAMEEVLREVPVVEDVRADKHAADCREGKKAGAVSGRRWRWWGKSHTFIVVGFVP
jgi:hypothetical protein